MTRDASICWTRSPPSLCQGVQPTSSLTWPSPSGYPAAQQLAVHAGLRHRVHEHARGGRPGHPEAGPPAALPGLRPAHGGEVGGPAAAEAPPPGPHGSPHGRYWRLPYNLNPGPCSCGSGHAAPGVQACCGSLRTFSSCLSAVTLAGGELAPRVPVRWDVLVKSGSQLPHLAQPCRLLLMTLPRPWPCRYSATASHQPAHRLCTERCDTQDPAVIACRVLGITALCAEPVCRLIPMHLRMLAQRC